MGLSIHYKGRFNKNSTLSDLITEVKEIVETFKWDYQIYLEKFPDKKINNDSYNGKIYGISFTPPKCETISICFLSNYRMSSSIHLKLFGNTKNKSENKFLYMLSAKTQFAGITIHKAIIELFRHLLKKNYFSEFHLVDEGNYWETGDENLLKKKFKEYNTLIDDFSLAIETIPAKNGESFQKYFERIMEKINNRKKNQ